MSLVALILVAAVAGYGAVACLRRGAGRIDDRRSVLIHAPAAVVWERVRRVPDLLLTFGKLLDHARMDEPVVPIGMDEPPVPAADDAAPGSRWRLEGFWKAAPYWAEVELVRVRPQQTLEIRLAGDAFKTERGLGDHRGSLTIEAEGPELTKLSWQLRAHLKGPRLQTRHLLAPTTVRARLLDLRLRAIKVALEKQVANATAPLPARPAPQTPTSRKPLPPPSGPRPPESAL